MKRHFGIESDPESEDSNSDPGENATSSDRDLQIQIFSTLQELKTPSAFAFGTTDETVPNPGLYIPPHGLLGLPLSTEDAQKIISQASQSAFGKGEETIVDISVRKSWELNPSQFSLKNPAWIKAVEKMLDVVCVGLGVGKTGNITAELYKLLLYEPGAFFKQHKDSEKVPGMFATLVVCLPSPHEGGKVVMSLDDEKYEFETSTSSMFGTSYAAWYADVTHEVLPVISGYRLILTYNLIRPTGFDIPAFDLVLELVQKLSTLLQQYQSRLEAGDEKLPPIILRKLKHKYTNTDLQLNTLKPRDLAIVQTLSQLAIKLGFQIYLATSELKVKKESEDYDYPEYDERKMSLENMVELDGKLIMKSFSCPESALIDPKPQDAGRRCPDRSERGEYSGNAGIPITYWYRDAVVVLVPPSKQLDFVFGFSSKPEVIGPLLCRLMEEYSKDPDQKQRLEQLLERILKNTYKKPYWCENESEKHTPPYYQQAAAIALKIGRIDLFNEACQKTDNDIILNNGIILGRYAAENGVASVSDQLKKGLRVADSAAQTTEFLKSVAEGFNTAVEPGSAERDSLKQWSDEMIFKAIAEFKTLTKADASTLAQLCKTINWTTFESRATPIILEALPMVKIAFIAELLSALQQDPNKEQRLFMEMIIHNVWNEFLNKEDVKEKDLCLTFQTTITVLSVECVETLIIPAILTAILSASKKCVNNLLILLVRMIIKTKLAGFKLAEDAVPPPSHKRLVQALLIKFLISNVRQEPKPQTDLPLSVHSCYCSDCSEVMKFLQDPGQTTLNILCGMSRRVHLNKVFTNDTRDRDCKTPTFDVVIINRNTWRITKHQRGYESAKSEWMKETKFATETLAGLKKAESVPGRLEQYLQPYHQVIMDIKIEELPDLESLVNFPQAISSGVKREARDIDSPEEFKRPKQETSTENVAPNHPNTEPDQMRAPIDIDLPEAGH